MAEQLIQSEEMPQASQSIKINGEGSEESSDQNKISTTKYEAWSFFPVCLFEQFGRLANTWFLIVSILQLLPYDLSSTSKYSTVSPLCLVILVGLLKERYTDLSRSKNDKEVNGRPVQVWDRQENQFSQFKWSALSPGHVILLSKDEAVPADTLLLTSSNSNRCTYVKSTGLDGSYNLKMKQSIPKISTFLEGSTPEVAMEEFRILEDSTLVVQKPSSLLRSFAGTLQIPRQVEYPAITIENVLLRGTFIKNTDWAIVLVVYTGPDTKLMLNMQSKSFTKSKLEKYTSKLFIGLMGFILTLTTTSTVTYALNFSNHQLHMEFLTFLILYNGIIPISLYVSLDIIRMLLNKLVHWDTRFFHSDTCPQVRNGDIHENLGQVEYVFTDKTGTLTDNQLVFKKCYIPDVVYGFSEYSDTTKPTQLHEYKDFRFTDPALYEDLHIKCLPEIREFFEGISLCHTVEVRETANDFYFEAVSADEEALLIAARCFGFSFCSRRGGKSIVNINGELKSYRVFGVNSFTSERRRMSVILEPLGSDKSAILYCKGDEKEMLKRCSGLEELSHVEEITEEFEHEGLRTLIFAKRELSHEQAQDFKKRYEDALNCYYDNKKELETLAEEFESEMTFLGVTAIEDKVQKGVPETVQALNSAGIKVWMLTGDKVETSVNIAFSCNLFNPNIWLYRLICNSAAATERKLKHYLGSHLAAHSNKVGHNLLDNFELIQTRRRSSRAAALHVSEEIYQRAYQYIGDELSFDEPLKIKNIDQVNIGLIVDGPTLSFIMQSEELLMMFFVLASFSQAVVCCTLSPFQKSDIVKMVKKHYDFKPLTLAVGDGPSDVPMMQEADIGIGIVGREGTQAANSSEISLVRFKDLLPLLLVHGRWNYYRISTVILYSVYKNLLLTLPIFFFSFLSLSSGSSLFDPYFLILYNIIFTSLPIIVLGITDQDIDAQTALKKPKLYRQNILNKEFNLKLIGKWIAYGFFHSIFLFFVYFCTLGHVFSEEGYTRSLYLDGYLLFICICTVANLVILLLCKYLTVLFIVSVFFSLFAPVLFLVSLDFGVEYGEMIGLSIMGLKTGNILHVLMASACAIVVNIADLHISKAWFVTKRSFNRIFNYNVDQQISFRAVSYRKNITKIFDRKPFKEQNDSLVSRELYSMSKFTLKFDDEIIELMYKQERIEKNLKFIQTMFWGLFVCYVLYIIYDLIFFSHSVLQTILEILSTLIGLAFCFFAYTKMFKRHYDCFILLMICLVILFKTISDILSNIDGSMSTALTLLGTFILFNLNTYKILIINSVFLLSYLIRILVKYILEFDTRGAMVVILNYWVILPGILLMSAYASSLLEKSHREGFVLLRKTDFQYKKSQNILGYLLPDFVRERVTLGIRYIADREASVTVLFCDIDDFDSICSSHQPTELIQLLDRFFTILDKLCSKHGLTKIETVNKTYMVCGGLLDKEQTLPEHLRSIPHAERCIDMALSISKKIRKVVLKTGENLHVKIGVNSGPVIAGVVGEHKPQFSLVGDTVNTASRMCSTIVKPGIIQISSSTYKCIDPSKYCMFPQVIWAKGKGYINTHMVESYSEQMWMISQGFKRYSMYRQHLNSQISQNSSFEELLPAETLERQALSIDETPKGEAKIQEVQFHTDEETDILAAGPIQWLECRLAELPQNRHFRLKKLEERMKDINRGLNLSLWIYGFLTVVLTVSWIWSGNQLQGFYLAGRFLCLGFLLVFRFRYNTAYKEHTFNWWVLFISLGFYLIAVMPIRLKNENTLFIPVLEVMFVNVVVNYISGLTFGFILYASWMSGFFWYACIVDTDLPLDQKIEITLFVFLFSAINCYTSYKLEVNERERYNLALKAEKNIKKSESLLSQMLPRHVLKNMRRGVNKTDRHLDVTIMYADITEFTKWSSKRDPDKVISMLSKLFCKFDHLCVQNQVYKVHTIGDCYVVLGFTDEEKREPPAECKRVVNMALNMIHTIVELNKKKKKLNFNMRIGIHTGTIIAGVTGTNIVRYDIYGPDNDIANKIESSGAAGRINVSADTKKILTENFPEDFKFIFNKPVTHKPTGSKMDSYFLEKI